MKKQLLLLSLILASSTFLEAIIDPVYKHHNKTPNKNKKHKNKKHKYKSKKKHSQRRKHNGSRRGILVQ